MCFNFNWAQQPASIHLTEKDGLPDIEFYKIIEDSNQFIWLAADKGLYRYDGQNYVLYSHPEQHGNAVFGIKEDQAGRVWFNNISGQFFYAYGKTTELFIDLSKELNGELSDFSLTKDALIVNTIKTIYKIDFTTKEVKKIYKADKNVFLGIQKKINNQYVFYRNKGFVITDNNYRIIDSLSFSGHSIFPRSMIGRVKMTNYKDQIFCYFSDKSGLQFYQLFLNQKRIKRILIPEILRKRIINQVFYKADEIWMVTDNGIQIYKLENDELKYQNTLFQGKHTTHVIVDSDDHYWVTTKGDGIFVIANINVLQFGLSKGITKVNRLRKIDNNTVLFGTNNGVFGKLNTATDTISIIDTSSVYRITDIVPQSKSEFIIIKEDRVLNYNINKNRVSVLDAPNIIGAKKLTSAKNQYILSSYKNASLLNNHYIKKKILLNKRSYVNYYSSKTNSIFIGSVEGLFVFDDQLNKEEIKHNGMSILATSMTETDDGTLWVSTFKNGIFGVKNNTAVAHFGTKQGLLSNTLSKIRANKHELWIATNKGLQCLDTKTKTFKNLTKQNGVPSYRIADIEIIKDKILFASNEGMFSINDNKAFREPKPKELYFTEIKINDKPQKIARDFKLNYDQNKISFGFNVNGFQTGRYMRYDYRLLGADSLWKTTKPLVNSITYNSLPNGKYKFQVKPHSAISTTKSIKFKIAKPFWKRWWFYILCLTVFTIFIFLSFKRQENKIKAKQTELLQKEMMNKQLVMSQLENLRSQMNPHFIFNALNSIQEYIVLNEKDLASSFLIKFSRLIRIYLDHSRESDIVLSEEIDALHIYLELEKNRFEDALTYTINVSDKLDVNRIKIPSLFIQPYVENALKHGLLHKKNNRNLSIDFDYNSKNNQLICSIEDNGIGVEASQQINLERYPNHKSFATSANKKRVQLLNKNRNRKIEVAVKSLKSDSGNGTVVIITIPLKP